MIKLKIKIKWLNFDVKKVESRTRDTVQDLHQYAKDELMLDKVSADVFAAEFASIKQQSSSLHKMRAMFWMKTKAHLQKMMKMIYHRCHSKILKVISTTSHQNLAKLLKQMKTNIHRVLAHPLLLIYFLPQDFFHQIFVNFLKDTD